MNAHQISEIKITPDVVDCIVFWTKNPLPMMKMCIRDRFLMDRYLIYLYLIGRVLPEQA